MNTSNRSSTSNRCHWIAAAMLAALICGVSCEAANVETNDQKLLALCREPKATTEAIEALLKAGADIEARMACKSDALYDEGGVTPLMRAARRNESPEVIAALLKAGANARAKDKEGKTALDHAKDNEKIYKTKVYWKLHDLQYE